MTSLSLQILLKNDFERREITQQSVQLCLIGILSNTEKLYQFVRRVHLKFSDCTKVNLLFSLLLQKQEKGSQKVVQKQAKSFRRI